MKNRKLLGIFLTLAIMIGLTSCTSPKQAETKNKQIEKNETVTNIVFWHHYNEQSNENKVLMEILIPEFEKQNPDVKVEAVSHDWADLHNKALVAATASNLPDVIRVDSAWIPEFVDADMLMALDEEFEEFNSVKEGILTGPMDTANVKGHYYGLGLNTNTKILFYNTKLMGENDVEVPKTLDEFFEAARNLSSEAAQKIWGYGEPALSGWNMLPFIWSNGGELLNEDNSKAEGYLNSEANVELLSKFAQLYKDGFLSGFNSGDIPMTDGFAQGRYAMIIDGPWKYAELQGGHADFTDYDATTMPAGKNGSIQVLGGEDISISRNANKEAAWKFVKFMTNEFAQVEMGKAGQIPVNKKALENAEITSIKNYKVFLEAIKTSRARPAIPQWSELDQILTDAVTNVVLKGADAKETLDEAARKMDEVLR
ncbi:extracellular solute-binding protein [Clostridiales bacterium COT073_COT-073]|nr:extracellular solute-binding protein [Clostridiales bacterium COT073_COT-073]